jgi:NADH-quinone oxidoreductase subunit L
MFLALGIGAWAAGVFHVFTHAFFKALLFLGSGSVIHALSGEQDMRNMGDLKKRIPVTYRTMLIGTLAIAGIFPLAGFVSKDEILWQAWSRAGGAYRILWGVGFVAAMMTAFYMFRLIYLTFFGQPRMSHDVEHHIHESPRSMTVPLMVLAFFSIVAGFLGWPASLGGSNMFEHYLSPVFEPAAHQLQAAGEGEHVAEGAAGAPSRPSGVRADVPFGGRGGGCGVPGVSGIWQGRQGLSRAHRGGAARLQHALQQVLRR